MRQGPYDLSDQPRAYRCVVNQIRRIAGANETDVRRVAVAGLSAAGVVVVAALALRTPGGQNIDELARESRKLTDLGVRRAGVVVLRLSILTALPVTFLAALVSLGRRRRWRTAAACAVGTIIAVTVAEVSKARLGRPALSDPRWLDERPTFPSGHATAGMAVALTAIAATEDRRSHVTWIAAATGVWALTLTGSGWHRPSDIIAGFLIASTCFALVGLVRDPDPVLAIDDDERSSHPGALRARTAARVGAAVLVSAYYLPLDAGPAGFRLHLPVYIAASILDVLVGVGIVMMHAGLLTRTPCCEPRR